MLRITVTAFALSAMVVVAGCASTGGTGSVVAISSARPSVDTASAGDIPTASPGEVYRVFPGDEINGTPVQGDPPF